TSVRRSPSAVVSSLPEFSFIISCVDMAIVASRVLVERRELFRRVHRLIDSAEDDLLEELLEQREQFEHRPLYAVAQRGNDAIVFPINRPIDNLWSSFAARPPLPFFPSRSDRALGPASAGEREALPAILAGNDCRVVADCDECPTGVFDDIEFPVFFIYIEHASEVRHRRGAAIAAGARDANPIGAAGSLAGVLARLKERAVVADEFGLIGHALRLPDFGHWQLARHCLETLFQSRELRFERAPLFCDEAFGLITALLAMDCHRLGNCVQQRAVLAHQ